MMPRLILLLICLSAAVSCDDAPPAAPATSPANEAVFQLDLKPLTPLLPNRPTHVAVDPLGNVYWVQEADRRDDTLFVIGEGEIPRATQLSAATIASALNVPNAHGNIQGIGCGAGGEIYFYFTGSQERTSLSAFGRFFPKTSGIQILSDTNAIATATDMGLSLPLARGSIISDGRIIWLWVRHTDGWAMFKIDPRKLPTAGQIPLARVFNKVTLDERPIDLTRDELAVAAGPDASLFLIDPINGRILKIADDGKATSVRSLIGLPSALSTPAVDRKNQMLLFAAANSEIIAPSNIQDVAAAKPPDVTYPAMLIYGEKHTITIARDAIVAYPGFPVFGMHLTELIPYPIEEGWVSYDSGSGELLRLKIREKLFP